MGYTKTKNKTVYRRDSNIESATLASSRDSKVDARTTDRGKFYELEPGEVVDIILDQFHSEFKDWRDIGKIKVRLLHSEVNRDFDSLQWIKPQNNSFKVYPLLHEIVIVGEYTSERATDDSSVKESYYLMPPINIFNSVNENALPNVSIDSTLSTEVKKADVGTSKLQKIKESESGINTEQPTIDEQAKKKNPSADFLGNTFSQNYTIKPLLPFEGDIITEGRFGQSIRFGSTIKFNEDSPDIPGGGHQPNWWSEEGENGDPILIIRNGQSKDNKETDVDEPSIEDIDNDSGAIYITAGQTIHFKPASDNVVTWQKTQPYTMYNSKGGAGLETLYMEKYPFKGNQILMASDRIVLNARENELMGYSKAGIGFSTDGDFHINCRALRINAQEIHTMSETADAAKGEPQVLGRKLTDLLKEMLRLIYKLRYPGAPGILDYSSAIELQKTMEQDIDKICSKQAFLKPEKSETIS